MKKNAELFAGALKKSTMFFFVWLAFKASRQIHLEVKKYSYEEKSWFARVFWWKKYTLTTYASN